MRHRRKLRVAAVLALVFVVVGWAGGNWFVESAEPSPKDVAPDVPGAEPSLDAPAVARRPAVAASTAHRDVVAGEPPPSNGDSEPALSPTAADRFVGAMSRIDDGLSRLAFGDALIGLRDARALALPARERARVDRAEQRLREDLGRHVRAALHAATLGRVLEAESALSGPTSLADPIAVDVLAESLRGSGWSAMRTEVVGAAPPPAALPSGRRVRCRFEGRPLAGVATSTMGERVGVEIEVDGRLRWPVVARHDLEPIDPTPTEALDQCAAAIRAGRGLNAALWLRFAAATGSVDRTRLQQLESSLATRR